MTKADVPSNVKRTAVIVKRGPAEPLAVELYDIGSELDANRKEFLGYTNAVYADFLGETVGLPAEDQDPPEWASAATEGETVAAKTNFDLMSAAAIKKMLTAKGVEYPDRVTRPKLLALANAHLT